MKDFSLYKNQEFNDLPERVIGCNIEDCTFGDTTNTTFERCNIRHCKFTTVANFDRTNVIVCEVVDGSVFEKSSNIQEEPEDRIHSEEEESEQE